MISHIHRVVRTQFFGKQAAVVVFKYRGIGPTSYVYRQFAGFIISGCRFDPVYRCDDLLAKAIAIFFYPDVIFIFVSNLLPIITGFMHRSRIVVVIDRPIFFKEFLIRVGRFFSIAINDLSYKTGFGFVRNIPRILGLSLKPNGVIYDLDQVMLFIINVFIVITAGIFGVYQIEPVVFKSGFFSS